MTKAMRLAGIIVGIAILVSAIAGTGTYFLINHINNTDATTETSYVTTTNLFNTDGTINPTAATQILAAVGYLSHQNDTGTYTAHNIAGRTSNNSGATIIFPMGYVNGTSGDSLYWQATYLHNNYLTIWLTKNYTESAWNSSAVTVSYDTYASSTVQNYINGTFYPLVTQNSDTLKSIFATPKTAGYQTLKSGTTNDTSYYYNSSYTSKFDNMSTTVGNSHYMWLPSHGEVSCNTSSSYTNNTTSYTGQWGLNKTDRSFKTSLYSSSGSTTSYCWLRSGNSGNNARAMLVNSSGDAGDSLVFNSGGVRPAAHISLSALYNVVAWSISSVTENSSVDKTNLLYKPSLNIAQTLTFTPNTNYYMDSVTIGATDGSIAQMSVAINNSQPSDYSNITNLCKYKVYREGNTVKVVVNELTEDITITGSANAPTMTISTGSNISNLSLNRDTYLNTTGTVSATFANGYYPQFSYNSSTPVKASGSAGKGGFGSVQYSYTFTSNVLIITFTNLPTGANNIPTLNLTAYSLDNYNITVNTPNCVYEIIYENTQTIINVTPNTGYYITQAYVDSNAPEDVKFYRGYLVQTGGAFSISYETSVNSSKVKFIVKDLSANLTLNIVTGNTKPILEAGGGSKIDGVALQTKLAGSSDTLACVGKATITGYTTTDGLDDVIVYATASAGYKFDHWEIDGAALDTSTYGISAYIPYEMLDGKILVAVFAPNTTNTNDNTNTPDSGGFV